MAPRRMISSGRAGLRCQWEPDTKRASGEARFFVQSPQGSQISDFQTRRFCSTQEPDIAAFPRD